jgi:energy-coupling factor transport system ATP-binding protein
MEEALGADKVFVMTAGNIVTSGTPRDVFADEAAIAAAGLDFPPHIALYHRLKSQGIDLGACPLTVEELVQKICPLN